MKTLPALWALLLASAPLRAADVTRPLELPTLPLGAPSRAVEAPVLPALPALPALPPTRGDIRRAADIPAAPTIPGIAPEARISVTGGNLAAAAAPAQAAPAAAPSARESAEDLVRRLLRETREQREDAAPALADTFDGSVSRGFADSAAPGTSVATRRGDYTLASSKTKTDGEAKTVLERWEGPHGGLWVRRRRGPQVWDVREWRGKIMPEAFGPEGVTLPPSAEAEFELDGGRLMALVTTADESGPTSALLNAKEAFRAALAHFGSTVRVIEGLWSFGTNLAEFNRLVAEGVPPAQAAQRTWTGRRAAEARFGKAVLSPETRARLARVPRGPVAEVAVEFRKR